MPISTQTAAVSCYRAYQVALGQPFKPAMADIPAQDLEVWRRFASDGPELLETMSGKRAFEMAKAMWRLARQPLADAPEPPRAEMLAWEAATRHLAMLLGADPEIQVEELPGIEAGWFDWAKKRTIFLGS